MVKEWLTRDESEMIASDSSNDETTLSNTGYENAAQDSNIILANVVDLCDSV